VQTCATAAESNAEYRRTAAASNQEVSVLPSWASPTAVYCALPSVTAAFDYRALYTAKPELLKVLRASPRADPDQTVFEYAQVRFSIFFKGESAIICQLPAKGKLNACISKNLARIN